MTQVWPRTDDFARTPDILHANLTQYTNVRMTSGYSTGYLAPVGGDLVPSAIGVSSADPVGFLWRDDMPQDCSVEAWFSMGGAASLGVFSALTVHRFGLYARVSGGTRSGAGTDLPVVDNPTAIGIECTFDASNPSSVKLRFDGQYWNGGTPTALGLFQVTLLPSANGYIIDVTQPLGLRLDVMTIAGFFIVWGWIINITANGTSYSEPLLIFNNGAASPSALLSAGRAGFVLGRDRQDPVWAVPTQVRSQIHYFQVREITGLDGSTGRPIYGDVILRDEFQRASTGVLKTNAAGLTGRTVQSGYFGDQHANDSPGILTYTGTSTSDRPAIAGTSTSAATVGSIMSMRLPDNPRIQHPQLRFNLNLSTGSAGTSNELGAGVWVHASGVDANGTDSNGYAALLMRVTGGSPSWRFDLFRIRSGAYELIAQHAASFMSGVSTTSTVYVALEVTPLPGTPSLDGPVRLRVRGGTSFSDITMTVQPGFPGIAADGDYIIDSSSDRITSGAEGLFFIQQNGTYRAVFQESSQGTLIDPPATQNDLPSIALDSEPTATVNIGTVAEFVLPIESRDEWFTLGSTRVESGHLWTMAQESSPRRVWRGVETRPMTKTARDAFLAFWRVHGKPGAAFFYTDAIKGETYTVRALEGSLREDRLFKNAHVFRFDMEELRT